VKHALPKPSTEAELCDALTIAAQDDGWDVYPEVDGWDLVLVWTGRVEVPRSRGIARLRPETFDVGHQIAVEAKLRANVDAIWSAVERSRSDTRSGAHADETAVLVPHAPREFVSLSRHLGLREITLADCDRSTRRGSGIVPRPAPRPAQRLTLPPIALVGSGGSPSPRTLSPWRIGALRIVAVLRARGYITRDDFRAHSVDRSRWVSAMWIKPEGSIGRLARYVPGPRWDTHGPHVGYEAELEALAAHDAHDAQGAPKP
jgi:hypothetical protein